MHGYAPIFSIIFPTHREVHCFKLIIYDCIALQINMTVLFYLLELLAKWKSREYITSDIRLAYQVCNIINTQLHQPACLMCLIAIAPSLCIVIQWQHTDSLHRQSRSPLVKKEPSGAKYNATQCQILKVCLRLTTTTKHIILFWYTNVCTNYYHFQGIFQPDVVERCAFLYFHYFVISLPFQDQK